jgi:hypothetical protein
VHGGRLVGGELVDGEKLVACGDLLYRPGGLDLRLTK